jgi:hypothetical protein
VNYLLRKFRRRMLGLSSEETRYDRRGFRGASDEMRARLEKVGAVFMGGYHAALEHNDPAELAAELNQVEREWRGFAFEGAAMGLALLDRLTPWGGTRISRFLSGAGEPHTYMVLVGVGWVWGRLPMGFRRTRQRLDPLLGWLAFDGWGFHEGFFRWPKYIAGQPAPKRLMGYEQRVFDQGLGRSWWFVNGGIPELVARTIGNFPEDRRGDLWSGIGLAATYCGLADEVGLRELREHAGSHWRQLGQGSAFAAKARQRAGNLTDYTTRATQALCGLSAEYAARLCDTTLQNLPPDGPEPAYELWRKRIQQQLKPAPSQSPHASRITHHSPPTEPCLITTQY